MTMTDRSLAEIMLDMFDGKTSADEAAAKMYEAFYGKPCPVEYVKQARGDDND